MHVGKIRWYISYLYLYVIHKFMKVAHNNRTGLQALKPHKALNQTLTGRRGKKRERGVTTTIIINNFNKKN